MPAELEMNSAASLLSVDQSLSSAILRPYIPLYDHIARHR